MTKVFILKYIYLYFHAQIFRFMGNHIYDQMFKSNKADCPCKQMIILANSNEITVFIKKNAALQRFN